MSTVQPASPQQVQKAQTFFQYGNDAALKGNHDYAIQMYLEACKLIPDNLTFRQALRGVERRKFGNDPSKVGRLIGARLQPLRLKAKSAKSKKDWNHVLEVCEEAFQQHPWDTVAAMDAAEACEELGYKPLAQWLVESVQAQGESDADFLRFAAHIHELNEAWPKAIWCWEKVKQLIPHEENASRRINDLSARSTIARSGLGNALNKTATGGSGPEKEAPSEIESLRVQQVTPEQRYLKEIEEEPSRIGAYLALADLYKSNDKLDEAEQILAKGIKASPDDTYLRNSHAEIQIARLKRAVEAWSRRVKKDPNDAEALSKLKQLQETLANYEVKDLKRRIAARTDDLSLRLQLGQALAKLGRHDEAIAEFQQARSSATLKVQALYHAGLSFEANGVNKLAERSFLDAIRACDPEDFATLNGLHYRLGRIAEAQGNKESAEEHFNEVAANDYSYLDVAQRLRQLNQKPVED